MSQQLLANGFVHEGLAMNILGSDAGQQLGQIIFPRRPETISPPLTKISTSVFSERPQSLTIAFGILRARLLPHLTVFVSIRTFPVNIST